MHWRKVRGIKHMEKVMYYPGSVGELIQGNINGIDVLVSCPVNLFTKVKIFEDKKPIKKLLYPKASLFMKNILEEWKCEEYIKTLDIEIASQISQGKGFSSSTADLSAVYHGLLNLFNKEFNEKELIKHCINIEPTDSIIFKDMTVFDYKNGQFYKKIGNYIEFYLLVFEGSKIIDTVEFNKSINIPLSNNDDIYEKFILAIKSRDIKTMAQVSEESIRRNCIRLNYEVLPQVDEIKKNTGGVGIIGAHSGDVLAIVYDNEEDCKKALRFKDSIKGYKGYNLKTLKS